jgi:hypothetical protein
MGGIPHVGAAPIRFARNPGVSDKNRLHRFRPPRSLCKWASIRSAGLPTQSTISRTRSAPAMLARVSEAQFIEILHEGLANELRAKQTASPVYLMSPMLETNSGTWFLRSELLFVPHNIEQHQSHRRPYQND